MFHSLGWQSGVSQSGVSQSGVVPCTRPQPASSWSPAAAPAGLCFAPSLFAHTPGDSGSPAPPVADGYCGSDSVGETYNSNQREFEWHHWISRACTVPCVSAALWRRLCHNTCGGTTSVGAYLLFPNWRCALLQSLYYSMAYVLWHYKDSHKSKNSAQNINKIKN